MCKLRYQKDAMEIAIDSEFPFQARSSCDCRLGRRVCVQELERQAKEEFGIFSDVIIKYEVFCGLTYHLLLSSHCAPAGSCGGKGAA